MRNLEARHKWMAECVSSSLLSEDHLFRVEQSMREQENYNNISTFLDSKTTALKNGAEDERLPLKFCLGRDPECQPDTRCVYFLRADPDNPVRLDVASNDEVLFGEVGVNRMESLNACISEVFVPSVKSAAVSTVPSSGGFGCSEQYSLLSDMCKFSEETSELLMSMSEGIKFVSPSEVDLSISEMNSTGLLEYIRDDTNAPNLLVAEKSLDVWIQQVDSFYQKAMACRSTIAMENNIKMHEVGPRTEIEYWRSRLHKLASVSEQVDSIQFRAVFRLLHAVNSTKVGHESNFLEKARITISPVLRRWKMTESLVNDALIEARDNYRVLTAVDKSLEPLYSGGPLEIASAMPIIMNSIKMLNSTARFYNTTERMTDFLSKVTNQIILNCKAFVKGNAKTSDTRSAKSNAATDSLWTQSVVELFARFDSVVQLNDLYQEEYRQVKVSLEPQKGGDENKQIIEGRAVDNADTVGKDSLSLQLSAIRPLSDLSNVCAFVRMKFDFNEISIFGKFDLFVRRIRKLRELFKTLSQFDALANKQFDGMGMIIGDYEKIRENFRAKRHDLLDYHVNKFDRDYVEFNEQIEGIETALKSFFESSIDQTSKVDDALVLLKKYLMGTSRESLLLDLKNKYPVLLNRYYQDLLKVQDLYEKCKSNPPIARNMPPVSGNVLWARHLLTRIEGPMAAFQETGDTLSVGGREVKSVLKLHARLSRTLVEFEHVWHQAWLSGVEEAKSGLRVSVLVRHPDDGNLYVNMDPQLLQLIREAKILERLGKSIPQSVKIVLIQETRYKKHFQELEYILREYKRRIEGRLRPLIKKLLAPHIAFFERVVLGPGLDSLTWTSLNIDSFIDNVWRELNRVEQLVKSVNDTIDYRIERILGDVSKTPLLLELPEKHSVLALGSFVDQHDRFVADKAVLLKNASVEIELAVNDLLQLVVEYRFGLPSAITISQAELVRVKAHFNWSLQHSILNCTRKSLMRFKQEMIRGGVVSAEGVFSVGSSSGSSALFEIGIQLDSGVVRLDPSLEEIKRAAIKVAVAIINCSKSVKPWELMSVPGGGEYPVSEDSAFYKQLCQGTFFDRIVQDREILKTVLFLSGAVVQTGLEIQQCLEVFKQYSWLWTESVGNSVKALMEEGTRTQLQKSTKNTDLIVSKKFEAKLRELSVLRETVAEELDRQCTSTVGAVRIRFDGIIHSIVSLVGVWIGGFSKQLQEIARARLESLSERIKQYRKKLVRVIPDGDLEALNFVMNTLSEVRKVESDIVENEFGPVFHMYSVLDQYLAIGGSSVKIDKDEQDLRSMLNMSWDSLLLEAKNRNSELIGKQAEFEKSLVDSINSFAIDVSEFRAQFEANGPMVPGLDPAQAVERLKRFKEEFDVRERKRDMYRLGESLFGIDHRVYAAMDSTKSELSCLGQLYDLFVEVLETIRSWKDFLWVKVGDEMEGMKNQVELFKSRCKKLPKQLREWPAYLELKREIDDFSDVLPLLLELSKKSVQPRHWVELREITKAKELDGAADGLRLQHLLDARLNQYRDEILEITDAADKQLLIERKLGEIEQIWAESMEFEFLNWKNREYPCVLGGGKVTEIQEQLEEGVMTLNTMNAMRHSGPFKEKLGSVIGSLSDSMDVLEQWTKVQLLWTGLESVFTSGDIAKQMPVESKKFQGIDREWARLMGKSAEIKNVVACCQNELLKQLLPGLHAGLESCQKSLESYLEGKRRKFPRFYFVSDVVLLKFLSLGSDPANVQDDMEKLFEPVNKLVFDSIDKKKIIKIKSIMGPAEEQLELGSAVSAAGGGNVEDWLGLLESAIQKAVRAECKGAASQCLGVVGSSGSAPLKEFIDKFIAQVSLLGIQLIWTNEFQTALTKLFREKDKLVMGNVNKKFQDILNELVGYCLTDLGGSKMNRTKYETLVTIHVHQRDVFNDIWKKIKEHRIKDELDFDWLKQTRFYWKSELDQAVVSIADVDFTYGNEYLGVKERLVITPLTDRCYLTLSQAMGICYGGAPAGPAGTGKTETVKDLARTLGVGCVVTNCSDQHRSKDMASIFKGSCASGLWSCFDEFNRIELEVLSVVAMQIEAITFAKKQHLKQFMFPGDRVLVNLQPSAGYFITMNPGYAGRQNLPNNLKILFRSVSMMIPDREIIMKVKLASVGYSQMDALAKKFNVLYQLCEQQLSKQRHYDFGLRNVLSVLRTAGGVKRSESRDADEEMIFMRTIRDMNLSKLVADDVPLFLSLLKDIFPRQSEPPKKVYKSVESGIEEYVKANNLVLYEPWKLKVIQLYETSLVRHGLMLVGPSLCGKSEIINTLTSVLNDYCDSPHKVIRLNPKAITDSQMYGVKDALSDEWTPGVFSTIWQKSNNRALKHTTWIVCDGPVDAIWIENLNSVLDDNKILTLANNDRIPMTENCRIVFEVENLNNASPATVSRAGIIYVSESDLGWERLVESWLLKIGGNGTVSVDSSMCAFLKEWIDVLIIKSGLMEWVNNKVSRTTGGSSEEEGTASDIEKANSRIGVSPVMYLNESSQVLKFLSLTQGLLKPYLSGDGSRSMLDRIGCGRLVLYSVLWSIGGLFEDEGRRLFSAKLVEFLKKNGGLTEILPKMTSSGEGSTMFDYWPNSGTGASLEWCMWRAPQWTPPPQSVHATTSLLIPTMDSVRSEYLIQTISSAREHHGSSKSSSVLLLGASGTAKTTTVQMYLRSVQKSSYGNVLSKRINFSSATTPFGFQRSIEGELERKSGKVFCPPNGKRLVLFLDDLSMPVVNKWGDQVTLELVRQLVETGGLYFLEKDKRGEFKSVENVEYVGGMTNPGGGRNDIPNRLKSKFFSFTMTMPSVPVIDSIYGSILRQHFGAGTAGASANSLTIGKITSGTISVWERVKKSLLPTPARFHYVFNIRDLSRVFQGILGAPLELLKDPSVMVSLWRHECTRAFGDKLSRVVDKGLVEEILTQVTGELFPMFESSNQRGGELWTDFQKDNPLDECEEEVGSAVSHKIYEPVKDLNLVREKANMYLKKYNETFPGRAMNLVLFNDALEQLMKLVRILQHKRGSAMLVGVGGSGKQSLTKLAAYICRQKAFQISVTKSYNESSFMDDLRSLFVDCGQKNHPVTFLLTDSDVKSEEFLECMNSIMATGDVTGLFQKDEKEAICSEIRNDFMRERPSEEDTFANLYNYFLDRVRDNLHVVFCFSPVSAKFSIRAQKFPAIFSNTNINWFLPWPETALVSVAQNVLDSVDLTGRATADDESAPAPTDESHIRKPLYEFLGSAHSLVNKMTNQYYQVMRRRVYVTPRNYLCLIEFYKTMFQSKYAELNELERSVHVGLTKLDQAEQDVQMLKIELANEEKKLVVADQETNALLYKVEVETAKASQQAAEVGKKRDSCLTKKKEIELDQLDAEKDLAAAMPFLHEAENAVKSITAKDITELKTLKQPSDIIRLVFDGLLILQQKRVCEVKSEQKFVNKQHFLFIHDSYDEIAKVLLTDIRFLPDLMDFSNLQKDFISDETCELLQPYLTIPSFTPAIAKKASKACEGLCKWVGAMVQYHEAAKIVKPKMDYLRLQTSKLDLAMKELKSAEDELSEAMGKVEKLNAAFRSAMDEKEAIETRAANTKNKMALAEKLIGGLAGEKARWTEDSKTFAKRKQNLVGDVALASVFINYCGGFNSQFRDKLVTEVFVPDLKKKRIPVTPDLDIVKFFITDMSTIGEWAIQGLPSDELSIQNALMVTQGSSRRFALMIDPQAQAVNWIKSKERGQLTVTTLSNPRLKDQLEFTMGEGLALLIENVESEVDAMLDPVLDRAIVKKGKKFVITVADQSMDYHPGFRLYLTSRLPNPSFSPELFARCNVIDFTVTIHGLEQQLLGRVLGMEQKPLEDSLSLLMEEVNDNTKKLQSLDKQLLDRLSNSSKNLLDDIELIEVLGNTKLTAKEVEEKIRISQDRKAEINVKREQYRPVAKRGSILYFCMKDMSLVVNPVTNDPNGWMYNSSLYQFLVQFDDSVRSSEKSQIVAKRVEKIIDHLTYQVYRYVNRGLFERDKLLLKLMIVLRVLQMEGSGGVVVPNATNSSRGVVSVGDISLFLRGGSSLDAKSEKPNPFAKWMSEKVYLNLLKLSREHAVFSNLFECVQKNELAWRKWADENELENCPIPDYESSGTSAKPISPFSRCLLVRSFREDRTTIAAESLITKVLGARFSMPVTDSIESIYAESGNRTPILYLLSSGSADPTSAIDELCKKKRKCFADKVSMGEGQEVIALEKIKIGFLTGNWVLLQNSHLGLGFMAQLEELLTKSATEIDSEFRLWITCEVTNKFPIGLLQMCIKVTLEPPMGLRAGLLRTYSTIVSQETLDKVESDVWRRLVLLVSVLHSIVQERRKFGAIGWSVPYEFNSSDLEASLLFLEKNLLATVANSGGNNIAIDWSVVQYMVGEVQYGGRITDDLDRELFNAYAKKWLCEEFVKSSAGAEILVKALLGDGVNGGGLIEDKASKPRMSFMGSLKLALGNSNVSSPQTVADPLPAIPSGSDIGNFRAFIESLPAVDSPSVYGLHGNADLSYRQLESNLLLSAILETQPKDGSSSSSSVVAKSRDETVKEKASDLLNRMPKDFVEDVCRVQVSKLKGPPGTTDKGFQAPLNVFLFQEIQRVQKVISIVRSNLTNLVMAIDGTVVMTQQLLEDLNMIFDGRIPKSWTHDASGAEISWMVPSLGSWFTGLIDRVAQLQKWLENGRAGMRAYWLGGFLNPQGFLTGLRQEVTRQHKRDSWALDDVVTHTEIMGYDVDKVRDVPEEGQYIYGLHLEGAKWNKAESRLEESDPKKLNVPMPVMYVTAITLKEKRAKGGDYGPYGPYDCPVYKYPKRTDKYLILRVNLKTNEDPSHWKLRGVSILCSIE